MNKKGDTSNKFMDFMIFSIVLVAAAAALIIAVFSKIGSTLELSPEAEMEIYTEGMLSCFAYKPVDSYNPKPIIDKSKITDENMGDCFQTYAGQLRFVLEEVDTKHRIIAQTGKGVPHRISSFNMLYYDHELDEIKTGKVEVQLS